ncbi:type VI secretion system tip protein VgrG [Burkholderia cepacia]|uniref:type VI secretion system Vgr family protein n=1 Tax=Burkholderia TaxID=32008 RepID=UPI00075F674E|nr:MULTISPECIES: type VI secretion system Vgr family protein [Burkholderia]KVX54439.1 type IV secretion protein Rhs [Burkholderia cepacia]KWC71232.1 type IV secretion protein Rhs [Burkholderia cepacia]KWD66683.1 type IV secretion protein Rhs [Burkholderia cepacia]KWD72311.1 type IV secretion protein Rhs [Burkholderia cepacia]MCA7980041.1 type VI secretion system tip protein VgrG [Burkholderia cepacia]
MNIREAFRNFVSGIDTNRRPVTLNWGAAQKELGAQLALQHVSIRESMMTGIDGRLTCVSQNGSLPPKLFIGAPVSVGLVTDRNGKHAINAIISAVQVGRSDGELTIYQFTVTDAVNLLHKRTNSRIFRNVNVIDVLNVVLNEWRQRSQTLASAFEFDLSGLNSSRYPKRSYMRQVNESDARFVSRLLRRDGITMFVRPGRASGRSKDDEPPVHTMVFCDDPHKLPEGPSGTVRLHPRDAGTEERDTITVLTMRQELISGEASRPTWDYRKANVDQSSRPAGLDQGAAGNDLAQLLTDIVIESPHVADSWSDLDRITEDRILAREAHAVRYDGKSGIRDLQIGTWVTITGDSDWNARPAEQRQFVLTSLHHNVWNNLPKELSERAQTLFSTSHSLEQPTTTGSQQPDDQDTRYENQFTCVPRGTPLTPIYDTKIDLPLTPLITGRVVGSGSDEVTCDETGCVYVMILGQDAADHTHAQGAGTNGNLGDSAPIRVASSLAGPTFGQTILPRVNTEVLLGCLGGDPDRLIILGVLPNGANMPAAFSHTGSLPGNRYLTGIKTKEISGQRYNQLRLDDTPKQISAQLASEHAHSQLNLGYLTQPRDNGQGADRGQGAELRTDAAAALRAAQGMLLTTYARTQASGGQLDRDELIQLLQQCTDLFKSLGDYAGQHGGQATDTAGQSTLSAAFKDWGPGAGGNDASQALMAFGAQAGSLNITPKTHLTYAGENIDQVAANHLQFTSGQKLNMQAGNGLWLFAQSAGITTIANQGKLLMQSQNDDTQIDSAKNFQVTAAGGKASVLGKDQVVLMTSGGAYLKLDGANIELGCPGTFTVKSAGHSWQGPASMSGELPTFSHSPLGRVPKLVRATDGQPAPGFDAEVRKASGDLLDQQTDEAGKLSPINGNQFEQLTVQFIKKNI